MSLRDAAQEVVEFGPGGVLFRAGWELKSRIASARPSGMRLTWRTPDHWEYRLRLEDPVTLACALRTRMSAAGLDRLRRQAEEGARGRIVCFGRWPADFGDPIDWHRNPVTGGRWNPSDPSFKALSRERIGDVKVCWEAGRFPHAYHLARAAVFFPDRAEAYAGALARQIEQFVSANPIGLGIHWASGQEVGLRLLAWLFAFDVMLSRTESGRASDDDISSAMVAGAQYIEKHLAYARIAVRNNHLISESLALFTAGCLLSENSDGVRWRDTGRGILDEQAERQFYCDGGYLQQSHNYHRAVLQSYLWACMFARSMGDRPSDVWLKALDRSLDLLLAHQNPGDGRLPNYGSNDGALPSVLSTCDFSDMRPTLQAVSVLVRGQRVYEPGPWDEEAAWFLGVRALDAPLRSVVRRSVSFASTGYHVLRGQDPGSFGAFRCGTLRERFSQIDMLHLDVWWRGLNVLVDPGSYQYNGAPHWHNHFLRTASHNTAVIDGRDQMLHRRQFSVLYPTKAKLLRFEDRERWTLCEGEHYGYRRHAGRCVHRRSVLRVDESLWIVVDQISGHGTHHVRLQWQGDSFPFRTTTNGMVLQTPQGSFTVAVHDEAGRGLACEVVAGSEQPPRGWVSRYYGERTAAPSLVCEITTELPFLAATVLCGGDYSVTVEGPVWQISAAEAQVSFQLREGRFEGVLTE